MASVLPIDLVVRALLDWYAVNSRPLPWRRTMDPYAIWVSEIMLQQTQVGTVIPYWERWLRELPDVAALSRARPERVLKLWEGLGYYTRARHLHHAARTIMIEHGGVFPRTYEAVLALPGIGPYTAGAICSIAYNDPVPILDGNVVRVLTRILHVKESVQLKGVKKRLWEWAGQLVQTAARVAPPEARPCSNLNQALMELGAMICRPRQPECSQCPVQPHCAAHRKERTDLVPNLGQRPTVTSRRFITFIARCGNRFLVQQRPLNVVNGGLWEFPNVEEERTVDLAKLATELIGSPPESVAPLCTFSHAITRYRIRVEAYGVNIKRMNPHPRGHWRTLDQLDRLAFPSAQRRLLEAARLRFGAVAPEKNGCKSCPN